MTQPQAGEQQPETWLTERPADANAHAVGARCVHSAGRVCLSTPVSREVQSCSHGERQPQRNSQTWILPQGSGTGPSEGRELSVSQVAIPEDTRNKSSAPQGLALPRDWSERCYSARMPGLKSESHSASEGRAKHSCSPSGSCLPCCRHGALLPSPGLAVWTARKHTRASQWAQDGTDDCVAVTSAESLISAVPVPL